MVCLPTPARRAIPSIEAFSYLVAVALRDDLGQPLTTPMLVHKPAGRRSRVGRVLSHLRTTGHAARAQRFLRSTL